MNAFSPSPGRGLLFAGLFLLLARLQAQSSGAAEKPEVPEHLRGSQIEWTRLQTTDGYWNRHTKGDLELLKLMREYTSLSIGSEWHSASATDLAALCRAPFIFAADISPLKREEIKNLAEYVKRGGFLMIDACINPTINQDPRAFFKQQVALLASQLPALKAFALNPQHEIYSVYFKITDGAPITRAPGSWSYNAKFPLYALQLEDRIVCIISLHGLQCAWDGSGPKAGFPEQPKNAMKMATNVYIYAMMR